MTTMEAICILVDIKNFMVKPNCFLEDGTYTRMNPKDNIYMKRLRDKIYVCYNTEEPHDESIDCLAVHFTPPNPKAWIKLQPFAAKEFKE